MANYSIWVLEYAHVPNHVVGGLIYGAHNQGFRKVPYCYVLIKGQNHVAMVDVGYNHKEFGAYLADQFGATNWHPLATVLGECGVRPEDVDTVFITHVHFDHFGNVEDFPNATFYIQEREIAKWVWAMSLPERMQYLMVAVVDPRQRTLFGAAWTLGTLSRLLPLDRVENLAFYETTGWQGLMELETGSPNRGPPTLTLNPNALELERQ